MSKTDDYILAFDEINKLIDTSFENAADLTGESRKKKIEHDVLEILVYAYYAGVQAAGEMLKKDLDIDRNDMMEVIYLTIDGKDWEDRLAVHISVGDRGSARVLILSEYHRIWNGGVMHGAQQYHQSTGASVWKTWNTMLDNKVRDTHWYLEGNTVPLRSFFRTYDGDYALYPGNFQSAENNVNCRCFITLST